MSDDGPVDLRAAHRSDTRRRILTAVGELLADEHPASISVPAVSRKSGVSVATIYRYFPSKEALLDASARAVDVETRRFFGNEAPVPGRTLSDFMHRMWQELSRSLPALRASQMPGVGRDLRRRRSAQRLSDATRALEGAGVDLSTDLGQRLLRISLVLSSSSTLLEQIDRLDMEVEDGADDVVWAIEALTRLVVTEQAAGDPSAARAPAP